MLSAKEHCTGVIGAGDRNRSVHHAVTGCFLSKYGVRNVESELRDDSRPVRPRYLLDAAGNLRTSSDGTTTTTYTHDGGNRRARTEWIDDTLEATDC